MVKHEKYLSYTLMIQGLINLPLTWMNIDEEAPSAKMAKQKYNVFNVSVILYL